MGEMGFAGSRGQNGNIACRDNRVNGGLERASFECGFKTMSRAV